MEFRLELMKVMEKSWNFEIMAKSHGKVMLILYGHGILSDGHGKVMEFCHGNFVGTLIAT